MTDHTSTAINDNPGNAVTARVPALELLRWAHQAIGTHGIVDWLVDGAGVVFARRDTPGRQWVLRTSEEADDGMEA